MKQLNTALLYGKLTAKQTKERIKSFLTSEKGSGEIIAMVIIIGLVLVLAIFFSTEIKKFFESLWNNLIGNKEEAANSLGDEI